MVWVSLQLHDLMALMEGTTAKPFPEESEILLRRGQVGTVVVELSNGEAFEIEFSQSDGQADAMLAVKANQLIRLYYEPIELAAVG
ncbi:DUF4926 domain-containing protein [filamentous cyanobacterium CCP3]|nr:DUF4926 domain-containing protein [filamentous cyanobacterium CCP3]